MSNPIVMLRKSDEKYRFFLDFKKIDKITKKDVYPIPFMTEILDALTSAKHMSNIDLRWAYNQIPLDNRSKPITFHATFQRHLDKK